MRPRSCCNFAPVKPTDAAACLLESATMARSVIPEAEALLDKEVPVLDKGFVRLVDYMGGDDRIVQAARVSYGDGTKTVREDRALIHYLLRNRHTSPFEQVILTFHLKMPIFVARQWLRHRTARLNEISGRYSVMRDEFYSPDEAGIRLQSRSNRQGSSDEQVDPELAARVAAAFRQGQGDAYAAYEELLGHDVARELARINLPVSLYTEMYWQSDLNNLFHFLRLRMDWHAQLEIRAYGDAIAAAVRAVAPAAFEAFEEHILYGHSLARTELELVREALDSERFRELLDQSSLGRSQRLELLRKLGLE